MVRGERYKGFVEGGNEFLFDLESDPFELKNLIKSEKHEPAAQALRDRLREFLMTEQINYSAGYEPLADRVKETGENGD